MSFSYPKSIFPPTQLYSYDEHFLGDCDRLALQSLAGMLARQQPRLYEPSTTAYQKWLDNMQVYADININSDYFQNPQGLFQIFKSEIHGFIDLVNFNDDTYARDIAITLAAGSDNLVIASNNCNYITSDFLSQTLGIPSVQVISDTNENTFSEIWNELRYNLNNNFINFQPGSKSGNLADWAIFARAATLEWKDPTGSDGKDTKMVLEAVCSDQTLSYCSGVATGWGDEDPFVSSLSKYAVFVHPSDWAVNMAALANVDQSNLLQKQNLNVNYNQQDTNIHTVTFVMTDGDNLQWLFNDWYASQNWWGNSQRGQVPLGWTFSPSTVDLNPIELDQVLREQTTNDELVTGPSGQGYTFLDSYNSNNLDYYSKVTLESMDRINMDIAVLIGHSSNKKYLNSLLQQSPSPLKGVFYWDYINGYANSDPSICYFQNNIPVIKARYSLWENGNGPYMYGVDQLVQQLSTLTKNINNKGGYSMIPVHAWSHNYDDVVNVVNQLNALGGFDVVSPTAFVDKFVKNVGEDNC